MVCTNLIVFASGENLVPKFKDKADRVELLVSRNLHFLCFCFLMVVSDSFLYLWNQTEMKIATETRKRSRAFLDAILLLDPNDQAWRPPSSRSLAWPRTPLRFPGQVPLPFSLAATSYLCLLIPSYRVYPTPAMLLPRSPDLVLNTCSVTHPYGTSFSSPNPLSSCFQSILSLPMFIWQNSYLLFNFQVQDAFPWKRLPWALRRGVLPSR